MEIVTIEKASGRLKAINQSAATLIRGRCLRNDESERRCSERP